MQTAAGWNRLAVCCAMLLIAGSSANAIAEGAPSPADMDARLDTLFGAHRPYQAFLAALQESVAARDWPAVAKLVAYPLRVRIAAHRVPIRSSAEFVTRAPEIFTPAVIAAVQSQRYAELFANNSGLMIGKGEVWFSGICSDAHCVDPPVKITAINP